MRYVIEEEIVTVQVHLFLERIKDKSNNYYTQSCSIFQAT